MPVHVGERFSVRAFATLPTLLALARALVEANRRLARAFIAGRADVSGVVPPHGTTYCMSPRGGKADAVCHRLRERYHTAVVPGRFFEAPEHLRIGLGADPAATAEALLRVERALDDLAGAHLS